MSLNHHCARRLVLIVAVPVLIGTCYPWIGSAERRGGVAAFTAESINSAGSSFSSSGSVSLGATFGQPTSTKSRSSGDNNVLPGFWNQVSDQRRPAPTLFMFR